MLSEKDLLKLEEVMGFKEPLLITHSDSKLTVPGMKVIRSKSMPVDRIVFTDERNYNFQCNLNDIQQFNADY